MFLTHALRAIYRTVVATTDPFFKYVSLLLTGNSPVDTFVTDASTNNFAVSIVGDTKPNNFNPFTPGRFSNFFDGTGDGLVSTNIAGNLVNTDFTWEAWVNFSSLASASTIIASGNTDLARTLLYYDVTNGLRYAVARQTDQVSIQQGSTSGWAVNTWYHVALVRSGNNYTLYRNGVSIASGTNAYAQSDLGQGLSVGYSNVASSPLSLTGHISNVRVVTGTAVYTAAFTPSTTPLTAISGTRLLTCQSTRLIDASANAFTITAVGNVASRTFNPFIPDPTASTYGSAFFDGTGDYLSFPANSALDVSTGDFTVECWFYINSASAIRPILARDASNVLGRSDLQYLIAYGTDGSLIVNPYQGTSVFDMSFPNVSINAWHHVALVRTGTSVYAYLDGNRNATTRTISGSLNSNVAWLTYSGVYTEGGATSYHNGYVSNIRIVKGTALYTNSTYTVPTAPLTAITNTSLLTLQTNQAINNNLFIDDSTNNFAVTRVGNTTQGTFTPYGSNWSNYFDGSGDYLGLPANANLTLNGDFTIEFWIYLKASTGSQTVFANSNGNERTLQLDGSGTNWIYWDGSANRTLGPPTINLWMHIALSRSGSTIKGFLNGVWNVTITDSGTLDFSSGAIGYRQISPAGSSINGYMSDFRIVKGTAVYTANFTPPTAPLTAIANTSLLTCQSNRFKDDSTNNFAITKSGDVSVQRFSPFSPSASYSLSTIGGSGHFDGTGDYLVIASNTALTLSGDYTVEAWIYVPSGGTDSPLRVFLNNPGTSPTGYWFLFVNGAQLNFQMYNADVGVLPNVGAYKKDSWVHFAASRSGATTRIFVNGTQTYSYAGSTSFTNNGWYIGGGPDIEFFKGYIANHRVIKGTALYTAAFTPPTAPVTATSNTQLLLNFTDAGVVDNAMMNNLETVGDARVSRAVSKFGAGAMFFDGTGDGLYSPSSSFGASSRLFNFGTGNFTIEFWMYFNSKTGYQTIISYGYTPNTVNGWVLQTGFGDGKILFVKTTGSSASIIASDTGSTVNTGQWYHIAIVRSGSTTTIYRDGTSVGSGSDTNNYSLVANLYIGGGSSIAFDSYFFNGYIDDLRITKGVARYTANFTPPTAALPTS